MIRILVLAFILLPTLAFADGSHFFLPEPSPSAADNGNSLPAWTRATHEICFERTA
jgi:hypothetical protein